MIRQLGEGGNKKVYLCRDTSLSRDVAVAVIKTEGLDRAGRTRVSHEARAMAKLGDHPHIVAVYDVGEEGGQPFIVSQYIAGGTLEDLLARTVGHRLPIDNVLSIATGTCEALEHAHSCGIIHRDLKPANIFLTKEGKSKLGDFGLALTAGEIRLTSAGMIVGTANYMPPEVALGKPLDARGDLYSLGATLYEMVTGRPPFLGDDLKAIIFQHINAEPVPPSKLASETPRALDELILKLLKKNPQDRPVSAAAARNALRSIAVAPKTPMEMLASTVISERPDLSTHVAPDGTVSILFSDMENSTVMNERLGDLEFQKLLHDHNSLIRDQIKAHQGFEVKSMGDGFMVAFSSARRALDCAIRIQREFAAYNERHASTPIRVRIGLHTGEAIKEGSDFFGRNVNMAARIGAKAQGGTILVSGTFKEVAGGFTDFRFDQGRDVDLKGFSGMHRVFQVAWRLDEITCPKCAKHIPSTSRVCPGCSEVLPVIAPIQIHSAQRKTLERAAGAETTKNTVVGPPSRRSRRPILWVIGLSILIVGLMVGDFYLRRFLLDRQINHLLTAQQYGPALDLLQQKAQESPNDARLKFLIGECYLAQGDVMRAQTSFDQALTIDSGLTTDIGRTYFAKGLSTFQNSDAEAAGQFLALAAKYDAGLKPQIGKLFFDKGDSAFQLRDMNSAQKLFDQAVRYDSSRKRDAAVKFADAAKSDLDLGDFDGAERDAKQAVAYDPDTASGQALKLFDTLAAALCNLRLVGRKRFLGTMQVCDDLGLPDSAKDTPAYRFAYAMKLYESGSRLQALDILNDVAHGSQSSCARSEASYVLSPPPDGRISVPPGQPVSVPLPQGGDATGQLLYVDVSKDAITLTFSFQAPEEHDAFIWYAVPGTRASVSGSGLAVRRSNQGKLDEGLIYIRDDNGTILRTTTGYIGGRQSHPQLMALATVLAQAQGKSIPDIRQIDLKPGEQVEVTASFPMISAGAEGFEFVMPMKDSPLTWPRVEIKRDLFE
ncbi:MAG: protein kinase domain-containing protein [Candidatus Binataceae bacterium]